MAIKTLRQIKAEKEQRQQFRKKAIRGTGIVGGLCTIAAGAFLAFGNPLDQDQSANISFDAPATATQTFDAASSNTAENVTPTLTMPATTETIYPAEWLPHLAEFEDDMGWATYDDLPPELKNDESFALAAAETNGLTYTRMNESLQNNPSIARSAVIEAPTVLSNLPLELRNHPNIYGTITDSITWRLIIAFDDEDFLEFPEILAFASYITGDDFDGLAGSILEKYKTDNPNWRSIAEATKINAQFALTHSLIDIEEITVETPSVTAPDANAECSWGLTLKGLRCN
jgi:hypothetical protein